MASINLGIYQVEHANGVISCLKDGAVVDSVQAESVLVRKLARCLAFPKVGMSVSFSETEWSSLLGLVAEEAPVEEASVETSSAVEEPVAKEPVAEEVTPVVAPVSRRGRRRA